MATIIDMPKLSDTMTVGTLVKWLKKEGDVVESGTMIAEVETDKATMEVECFDDGVLLKRYIGEGDQVEVGGAIAAIGEKGEEAPEIKASGKGGSEVDDSNAPEPAPETVEQEDKQAESKESKGSDEPKTKPTSAANEPALKVANAAEAAGATAASPEDAGASDRIKASPLARVIASEKGIPLASVKGTGPGGRIVKADVLAVAANPSAAIPQSTASTASAPPAKATTPAAPVEVLADKEIPVSNMRAAIARALVGSKTQAPHFYLQMEVDGAPLAQLRESLNAQLAALPAEQGGGVKFTVNDLTLKAAAEAVRRVPAINRAWKEKTIVQHGSVHLAFGVAIDDGLVTPVIRHAESKSLRQIAAEAKELIGKARNKKLKPDEMSGSTLTVTNLGMFGISDFYGIINPPNAAILSIGATVKTPVVDDNDNITIGYRMKIGLSGDHRVIDGAVGAQYLAALKQIIEHPAMMLI
jgi:pyruvate dehydrogenase E2 component (dihydrolipoamide acetyltransferase)